MQTSTQREERQHQQRGAVDGAACTYPTRVVRIRRVKSWIARHQGAGMAGQQPEQRSWGVGARGIILKTRAALQAKQASHEHEGVGNTSTHTHTHTRHTSSMRHQGTGPNQRIVHEHVRTTPWGRRAHQGIVKVRVAAHAIRGLVGHDRRQARARVQRRRFSRPVGRQRLTSTQGVS